MTISELLKDNAKRSKDLPIWEQEQPSLSRRIWRRVLLHSIALSLLIAMSAAAWCQLPTFPLPQTSGTLGTKDAGALAQITAQLEAVSAIGWHDLIGTGTLSYPAGDTHAATLYLMGAGYSRLDVVMDSETRSVRLQSSLGAFQGKSGKLSFLLPGTARAGIVAFPRVWTDAVSSQMVSLFDRGPYTGTGQTLNRITIEYQLTPGTFTHGDPTVATDLYLDPATHLLLYSVDNAQFVNSAGQSFLRVTSYGNYQKYAGVSMPTVIQQSLNGQLQWELQLNQLEVNTNPSAATFSF